MKTAHCKVSLLFENKILLITISVICTAQNCPVPCHRNATCIKSNDASQCLCNIGFTGNGMQCTSITACSNDNQCHANATCVDATGSAQCRCKPGFIGNGLQCTDADECAINTHKCHVNAECVNTVGSYQCRCRTGWQGNGTFCQGKSESSLCIIMHFQYFV